MLTGTAHTHNHAFPDVDAEPGTYPYSDGCAIIKRSDGQSIFIPNDSDTEPIPFTRSDD